MTDNMIEVPWIDGTTRFVQEGTLVKINLGSSYLTRRVFRAGIAMPDNTEIKLLWGDWKVVEAYQPFDAEIALPELPHNDGAIIVKYGNGKPTGSFYFFNTAYDEWLDQDSNFVEDDTLQYVRKNLSDSPKLGGISFVMVSEGYVA